MLDGAAHSCGMQRGRGVLWASLTLLLAGLAACGGDTTTGPPAPGSIVVRTQTTGFLKPAGYNLVVAGATQAIGASAEVTIPGLEPGDYDVALTDVPANCTAQGASSVTVTSNETVEAALTISCTFEPATSYTVQFSRQRPDFETAAITICSFGICPTQTAWDMWVFNSTSSTTYKSIVRQNLNTGVEIAHVEGVTLTGLNEAHFTAAAFTTSLVEVPFDPQRVILMRTDEGNVYALGNPSENNTSGTLTFDVVLIARP